MIKHSVETFTPETANAALRMNTMNRPLSKRTVELYAAAMKRGEWMLNGEPIIFAEDGTLLDGQTRLRACILSGVCFETVVERGVSKDVFPTLGGGKKRGPADVLALAGEKNSVQLAAAAKAFLILTDGANARNVATSAQIAHTVETTPSMRYWTSQWTNYKHAKRLFTSPMIAVLTLAALRHGDEIVSHFLRDIDTGEGLHRHSPALALREKFITKGRGAIWTADVNLALYTKSMNAYIQRRPVKVLAFKSGEGFPELV